MPRSRGRVVYPRDPRALDAHRDGRAQKAVGLITINRRHVNMRMRQLARLRMSGLKYAARNTLNDLAFEFRRQWQREMPQAMKLRNAYTQQSVRVVKAPLTQIETMRSVTGSVAGYMAAQEGGYAERKKHEHGVALPAAPPGKRKARGRVPANKRPGGIPNLVDFPRNVSNLAPGRSIWAKPSTRPKQDIAIALKYAKRMGGPQVAFLSLKTNRRGLYLLDPSKTRAVKKLIDLSHAAVTIPRNPTAGEATPAYRRTLAKRNRFWFKHLSYQIKKAGLRG